MKVLVVEDNIDIARKLSEHLTQNGYVVVLSHDGEDACWRGEEENFDAVLLDIGLPMMDGIAVLERWRSLGRSMPVIILTARTEKTAMIRGLESGADDYISKPFDMEEVLARLKVNIRRNSGHIKPRLQYGSIIFDTRSEKFSKEGLHIKLTRIEFLMLRYLFMNQGKLVGMTELTEHVYDDFDHDSSIVPRHIANIRKKVGADVIVTESNRGYYIPLGEGVND